MRTRFLGVPTAHSSVTSGRCGDTVAFHCCSSWIANIEAFPFPPCYAIDIDIYTGHACIVKTYATSWANGDRSLDKVRSQKYFESIDHVFIIIIISSISTDKEPTVCLTDVVVNVVNIETFGAVITQAHSARRFLASQMSTSRDLFRHHATAGARLDAMALRSAVTTTPVLKVEWPSACTAALHPLFCGTATTAPGVDNGFLVTNCICQVPYSVNDHAILGECSRCWEATTEWAFQGSHVDDTARDDEAIPAAETASADLLETSSSAAGRAERIRTKG
jgi:hypothetical protein